MCVYYTMCVHACNKQVSAPLALNLYTAVHNPITVRGRIALCRGALANIDLRPALPDIAPPIICVQSTKGDFVRPAHAAPHAAHRGLTPSSRADVSISASKGSSALGSTASASSGATNNEVRSIHQALSGHRHAASGAPVCSKRTCVVWVNAGHELLQEARSQVATLLEQMVTGYHERNDVAYTAAAGGASSVVSGSCSGASNAVVRGGVGGLSATASGASASGQCQLVSVCYC
jgi:hypothetical protein